MEYTNSGAIEAVTLYHGQAQVGRAIPLDYEAGDHRLILDALPNNVMESSVRASFAGDGGVTIWNIQLTQVMVKEAPQETVADLERQVREVERTLRGVTLKTDARQKQIAFVDAIARTEGGKGKKEETLPHPAASDLGTIFDFIYQKRVEAEQALLEEEKEKREISEELERLRFELKEASGKGAKQRKRVIVDFTAEAKGSGSFQVDYRVRGATWRPVYNIYSDTGAGKVKIGYQAEVLQNSGEDWNDVSLTLSTASPQMGTRAPKLDPWHVNVYEPPKDVVPPYPMAAGGMDVLGDLDDLLADEGEPVAAAAAPTSVTTTGVSALFKVTRKETIPSAANDAVFVTVADLTFDCAASYVSVPALSPFVYLRATFTNESDYPMLAGKTNVFVDDTFVGSGHIDTMAPGEEIELELGVDQGFKIERKILKREQGKEGLIARKSSVRMAWRIELESYKKGEQTVEIVDHLPFPASEEVVIKDLKLNPEPAEQDEQKIVTWKVPIAPQEKKEVEVSFTVEYPKGKNIVGLEG